MKASEMFDVSGLVVVVTGAAGGLGYAMSEVMAENDAIVVMCDIDADELAGAGRSLLARGLNVETAVLDVTDTARLRDLIGKTAAKFDRLDVVFANAGISAGPGPSSPIGHIEKVSLAAWQRVLNTNLTSVFATVQAAAEQMKPRRSGRIIVTSSIACFRATPQVGYAYVATKAAISNIVRQAAVELAPHNILVNAIAPHAFLTNLGGGRLRDPDTAAEFLRDIPLGRLAQTEEMKGLALLLASPASSFITGTVIPVDGGTTAH
jgi:NAD(P)-dependent dehydrogenase (short-subunit alcohol dehydrogenase family)